MIKKLLKVLGIVLLAVILILAGLVGYFYFSKSGEIDAARAKAGVPADTLYLDGQAFRDLNKNGELDPYEDRRISVARRRPALSNERR